MKLLRMIPLAVLLVAISCIPAQPVWSQSSREFQGREVFNRIINKAKPGNWSKLPIGELMGKIAVELEGTPYTANTLETSVDSEACVVNLTGLDCVTFFEDVLGFARMIKEGGHTPKDLVSAVAYARYRGGTVGDYTTRLHYLSDWFYDNQEKHVVKPLSDLPGAETLATKIDFMSRHPNSYRQLAKHPELVSVIKKQEDEMNKRPQSFVPVGKLAAAEPLLKTGDIVAITTKIDGLDVAHTGLVIRTKDGVAHFMDASSRLGKVTLETGSISQAIGRTKSWTGAMFARPLEP